MRKTARSAYAASALYAALVLSVMAAVPSGAASVFQETMGVSPAMAVLPVASPLQTAYASESEKAADSISQCVVCYSSEDGFSCTEGLDMLESPTRFVAGQGLRYQLTMRNESGQDREFTATIEREDDDRLGEVSSVRIANGEETLYDGVLPTAQEVSFGRIEAGSQASITVGITISEDAANDRAMSDAGYRWTFSAGDAASSETREGQRAFASPKTGDSSWACFPLLLAGVLGVSLVGLARQRRSR